MPYSGHPSMYLIRRLMKGFECLTVLRRVAFAAIPRAAGSATAVGATLELRWVPTSDSR